ncbi:hypothetical protein Tco_0609400 [Tanacetum coccineum]
MSTLIAYSQETVQVVVPPAQDTILGDRPAQTRFKRLSKQSNDPPLSRVNTLRSGEDNMKLNELMEICTKLSERVLALENIKTAQDLEITNLRRDINITTTKPVITTSAPVATARVSISTTEPNTPPTTITIVIEDEDLTIAQTLMKIRKYDADLAQRLQAELDEEARLKREREEEAIWRLNNSLDHSRIDADAQLAERLQAEEREQMFVEEQARLLMELIATRKEFFAAKRAEEQTYMKHMSGYKDKKFKGKSFDAIKQMSDKAYKQVNDFVPMDTDSSGKKVDSNGKKAESSKKRTRAVLDEESVKRQKVEDDVEKAELKACLEIVPGDDNVVNIESLATKYLIVDWKTHILTEDKMYQIIRADGSRADGSTKYYKIFSAMLDDFDRQDVLDLYRLVKERFETTSLEGYDRLLWRDLIILFEPSEEDEI